MCIRDRLISKHKAHESEYLRKSVGNALRDISKKHPELIRQEVEQWDLSNSRIMFTYKLAAKLLKWRVTMKNQFLFSSKALNNFSSRLHHFATIELCTQETHLLLQRHSKEGASHCTKLIPTLAHFFKRRVNSVMRGGTISFSVHRSCKKTAKWTSRQVRAIQNWKLYAYPQWISIEPALGISTLINSIGYSFSKRVISRVLRIIKSKNINIK